MESLRVVLEKMFFNKEEKKLNKEIYSLLTEIDEEFCRLEKEFEMFTSVEAYNKTVALIHFLIYALLIAEKKGWRIEDCRVLLPNAWRIHGYSSFGNHIQTWPKGYMGDYEVIDMIVDRKEESPPDSLGGIIGRYALNSPITQQHREKLKIQTEAVKKVCQKISAPKILSLACGSSRDLEQAEFELEKSQAKVVLVDFAPEALETSKMRLVNISEQIETLLIDVRKLKTFFRGLQEKNGKFHLILAGGLFDYLSDGIIRMIIKNLATDFLLPGGEFIFTNIANGNPYRPWMETMGNWRLIERSKEDIEQLLDSNSLFISYEIEKEPTSLSWIVKIKKTT